MHRPARRPPSLFPRPSRPLSSSSSRPARPDSSVSSPTAPVDSMQACDRCHVRKTRCDRQFPQCGACEKAGVSCVHSDKLRQRCIPRGYLDSMEEKVRQLQEENRLLRDRLASPSPAAATAPYSDDGASLGPPHTLAAHPISPPPSSVESQAQASSPDNVFAVEVGYLSLIATGETRFLGSSSGLSLANIISTIVSSQMGVDQEVPESTTPRTVVSVPADASALPPLSTVRPFIDSYFQHTHITFPLLHRPSFLAMVERIYADPGYYDHNPRDAFVFNMVLAIGSSNFNRFDESAANSGRYFAMAQAKLPSMISMDDSFTTLKAILLISQHGIFSNLRDTSASIWHLVGIGARICIEQGLHLERKHLACVHPNAQQEQSTSITLEEELRRRCFWSLYNLDRVVSFTLGRPVAIRDDEIDVTLPSHLDDECFSADRPITMPQPGDGDPASRTSPFLHVIRIRRLSGQILTQFYNSRQQTNIPMDERRRIRRQFHDEIDKWRDATYSLPGLSTGDSTSYASSFVTLDWYHAVYSNAILLLYRPSPFLPHPTMLPSDDEGVPELIQLLNAARSSIESYSHVHQKRRLNYSWITLHGVFIAGLSYIYALGRMLHDPAAFPLVPDLFSIVDVTRSCSNVLVAICERWNASRRSCDLFNKLSNAVIRDAVNASTKQGKDGHRAATAAAAAAAAARPPRQAVSPVLRPEQQGLAEGAIPYGAPSMDAVLHGQMQLDENFVMDEFRQFMGTLDAGHPGEAGVPSELASGFLQDWPFDIPLGGGPAISSSGGGGGTHMLPWDLNSG